MSFFKIILGLVVLFLAALGAFALFGIVAALFKYLLYLGVLVLVGAVAYKALKKSDRPVYQLADTDLELEKARRALEEVRRRQLTE